MYKYLQKLIGLINLIDGVYFKYKMTDISFELHLMWGNLNMLCNGYRGGHLNVLGFVYGDVICVSLKCWVGLLTVVMK